MPRIWWQIVRDVSDEDGLVGKFQANVHEVGEAVCAWLQCQQALTYRAQVSGKQVVDANKYALQVSMHAGIHVWPHAAGTVSSELGLTSPMAGARRMRE